MKKHFEVIVKGKVQGVFYRASTAEKANELQLKGIVKNLNNGDVYIEAEGEEEALGKLVDWCRQGPVRAKVEAIEIKEGEVKNYSSFNTVR